jgi:glycosyltransferase involved in cell wall biosynthesis
MVNTFPILITVRLNYINSKYDLGGTEKRAIYTLNFFKAKGASLLKYNNEKEVINEVKKRHSKVVYNFGAPFSKQTVENIKKLGIKVAQSTNFFEAYSPYVDYNIIISKFEYLKIFLAGIIREKNNNTAVVYNPLDFQLFRKCKKKLYKKTVKNELVIGRIARAEPSKWSSRIPFFLFWAALKLKRKNPERKITFLFAGMPLLYRVFIYSIKPILKIKNINVIMLPEIKNHTKLPEFYNSLDLFWQTSLIGESFGNVIAEAFASGKPVITDCKYFYLNGKLRPNLYDTQIELVDNEKTGMYINYPSLFFNFIDVVSFEKLVDMGKKCKEKALVFEKSKIMRQIERTFLGIKQTPNINSILEEYIKKRDKFLQIDSKISQIEKISFKVFTFIYRFFEYSYISFRKALRLFLKFDLESLNLFYNNKFD